MVSTLDCYPFNNGLPLRSRVFCGCCDKKQVLYEYQEMGMAVSNLNPRFEKLYNTQDIPSANDCDDLNIESKPWAAWLSCLGIIPQNGRSLVDSRLLGHTTGLNKSIIFSLNLHVSFMKWPKSCENINMY